MNGTTNTEQLPNPLEFALDEVLRTVNGVDPIEPDAEYEDCSKEELHIHKQLGRIRVLISQIRTANTELRDEPGGAEWHRSMFDAHVGCDHARTPVDRLTCNLARLGNADSIRQRLEEIAQDGTR